MASLDLQERGVSSVHENFIFVNYFAHHVLDFWHPTLKINMVYLLIMGNMCAKFTQIHSMFDVFKGWKVFITLVFCDLTKNIVAAYQGMHVSPAKHSYAWLPRKCDYRTDTQTDARQNDPYVPLCFTGDTKINRDYPFIIVNTSEEFIGLLVGRLWFNVTYQWYFSY